MKIRTDFVTNSSSSSFVVEISLLDVEGKKYEVQIPPYDPDGMCSANLKCSAKDIASVKSVNELVDLLVENAVDEEDESEFGEEIESAMQQFGKKVKHGISDIDQITVIKLKRKWYAWGEASSCFGWNLEYYAEELPELAEKVCNSEGAEKEAAKKDLADYLAHYKGCIEGEWGGSFPSRFLGAKTTGAIVWNRLTDTIEEFAQKVVEEDLPRDDYSVETTVIDMQNRSVSHKAEYILGGAGSEADPDDEEDLCGSATAGNSCEGLTFVITGNVNIFENRDAFTAYVESRGGKVSGSVSKNTDYLVNNDAASSSTKNKKARELGVPVITEDEFVERYGRP